MKTKNQLIHRRKKSGENECAREKIHSNPFGAHAPVGNGIRKRIKQVNRNKHSITRKRGEGQQHESNKKRGTGR